MQRIIDGPRDEDEAADSLGFRPGRVACYPGGPVAPTCGGVVVPLFGAHMSVAGGLHNALLAAQKYDCPAVQIFT